MSAPDRFRSACYAGTVTHHRLQGPSHRFAYPVYMHLIDLDELPALDRALRCFGHNTRRPVAFFDRDHFSTADTARAGVQRVVEASGVAWPGGRVEVVTHCRVFGYVFNPVSFWYCYRPDASLAVVVAEVNNTFGDRHPYVLPIEAATSRATAAGTTRHRWTTKKVMHVSPFFPLDGSYTWELERPDSHLLARVDVTLGGKRTFTASFAAERRPLSDAGLVRLLATYPLVTAKVVGAIHWEALRLWVKGAPFRSQPPYDPDAARQGVS